MVEAQFLSKVLMLSLHSQNHDMKNMLNRRTMEPRSDSGQNAKTFEPFQIVVCVDAKIRSGKAICLY